MAKPVKDRWLGARIDAPMDVKVKAYTEAAGMDMGELVRDAVSEYMVNHPVKDPSTKTDVTTQVKPGE